jgi:hypothetical protein
VGASFNAITATLSGIQTHLNNTITAMDEEGGGDDGDDGGLGDPNDAGSGGDSGSQSQFCQVLNFVSAAIGAAAFALSLGCRPTTRSL